MKSLDTIADIDHLRQLASIYQKQVGLLIERIAYLTKELATLRQQNGKEAVQLELEKLTQELEELQRSNRSEDEEEKAADKAKRRKQRKKPQTGHGPTKQPDLPLTEVIHTLDKPDLACPICLGTLKEFKDQFETSEEVTYQPPKIILLRHKRQKYRCKCGGCIETALGPLKLIKGGRYSIAFAIAVCIAKYLDHLPLERQVRQFSRPGLKVSAQTLFDQTWAVVLVLLPTYKALFERVKSAGALYIDDTGWKMMKPNDVQSWHLWNVNAGTVSWYTLSSTKGAPLVSLLLGDYKGIVVGDGAAAYASVQKNGGYKTTVKAFSVITPDGDIAHKEVADMPMTPAPFLLANCWAHVLRKFRAASKHFYRQSKPFLDQIKLLYEIEKEADVLALERAGPEASNSEKYAQLLEARRELRSTRSKPIVKSMLLWLKTPRILPSSPVGKAISYTLGLWSGLIQFLDHPEILLDNNRSERALRGPVIGRRNFAGVRSDRGAVVAAVLYSLFETAKLCGVNPAAYLESAVLGSLKNPGAVFLPEPLLSD